jgi:hypothetical protein
LFAVQLKAFTVLESEVTSLASRMLVGFGGQAPDDGLGMSINTPAG